MINEVGEIEYVNPSFTSHQFSQSSFDVNIQYEIVKMKDSTYIWIGNMENPTIPDLSYGIKSPYSIHPIASKILGTASADTTSEMMAERLTKKLKKPVYISFCLPLSNMKLLEEVEKRLLEEIEHQHEMF